MGGEDSAAKSAKSLPLGPLGRTSVTLLFPSGVERLGRETLLVIPLALLAFIFNSTQSRWTGRGGVGFSRPQGWVYGVFSGGCFWTKLHEP